MQVNYHKCQLNLTGYLQSDRYNKKNKNDCVYATWYAGVLACDLNTNLAHYTNAFFSLRITRITRIFFSTN